MDIQLGTISRRRFFQSNYTLERNNLLVILSRNFEAKPDCTRMLKACTVYKILYVDLANYSKFHLIASALSISRF